MKKFNSNKNTHIQNKIPLLKNRKKKMHVKMKNVTVYDKYCTLKVKSVLRLLCDDANITPVCGQCS